LGAEHPTRRKSGTSQAKGTARAIVSRAQAIAVPPRKFMPFSLFFPSMPVHGVSLADDRFTPTLTP
jgi:hypothetical protein